MNDSELDDLLNAWKVPPVPVALQESLRSSFSKNPRTRIAGVPLRWIAAATLLAGVLAVGASLAEDTTLGSEAGAWDSQTYVRRTRVVHPALASLKWMFSGGRSTGWQWQAGKLVGSVYIFERFSRVHYGYSWSAQPLGAGKYMFTVQPLDPTVLKEGGPIIPLPHFPTPAIVDAGTTLDIDLVWSNGQRVFDHIELSAQPLRVNPEPAPKMLTIVLTNPKLLINGQFVADSGGVAQIMGQTAMIDIPNRGRFVLTLAPQGDPRFLPIGFINENMIEFQSAGEQYRIECSAPIAANVQLPVYVYFKPDVSIRKAQFGSGGIPRSLR